MVKTLSVEQNKLDLKFQKGIILSQILKRSNLELRDFVFPLGELPQDEVGSGFVVESGVVDPHHRVVHPQVEPQQAKKSGRHDSLKEKHQKTLSVLNFFSFMNFFEQRISSLSFRFSFTSMAR